MENDRRKMGIKFFVTACILSAIYFFVSESVMPAVEVDSGSRLSMGTFARIVAVTRNHKRAKRCIEAGFNEFKRIENMLSYFNPDSELNKVNREASGRRVRISRELFEILQTSVDYSRLTNGAFDITVGPLVDLWRKAGEVNQMPGEIAIANTKSRVGYEKLILDPNALMVRFAVDEMSIDLGGIAKGYAVDRVVEVMKRKGAIGGMVDLGGNIRCFGKPLYKDAWLVGVQDPNLENNEPLMILKLSPDKPDMAVATSGDYRRFVEAGGQKVSHIIDTNTAGGAKKLAGDTIIAATAIEADALSTAVNVLGSEKGLELIERFLDVEAILITHGPEYWVIKSSGADMYIQ
jgi:thiamine biosynthesis lipoprotein